MTQPDIPDFAAAGKGAVTVRNVLEHRAGLGAGRILGDALVLGDRERATARVAQAPLVRQPGTAAGVEPGLTSSVRKEEQRGLSAAGNADETS